MTPPTTTPFVPLRPPAPDAAADGGGTRTRLFCLPYAGGGTGAYREWAGALPPSVEPVAVRLPGRESRFAEEPYDRMGPLVDHLLAELPPWLGVRYAVFGYSMGARVALALLQAARAEGLPAPAALFVGGSPGPSLPIPVPGWDDTDEGLTAHLRGLGGVPPEILADPDLMSLMLPTVRADLTAVATWPYRDGEDARLDVPVHAFAGTADEYASPRRMAAWARETTGPFRLTPVPGGHFFLHTARRQVLDAVVTDLAPRRPSPRR